MFDDLRWKKKREKQFSESVHYDRPTPPIGWRRRKKEKKREV